MFKYRFLFGTSFFTCLGDSASRPYYDFRPIVFSSPEVGLSGFFKLALLHPLSISCLGSLSVGIGNETGYIHSLTQLVTWSFTVLRTIGGNFRLARFAHLSVILSSFSLGPSIATLLE